MTQTNIRPLTLVETRELLLWAKAEGWNPGLADAECFHAADPQGFLGCFVEMRMIAGISAVRYGENYGFIGLYVCDPKFRGKGLGKQVWDHAISFLEGRSIGLDGVPQQQQNYASMGFRPYYRTWRWSGKPRDTRRYAPRITAPDEDTSNMLRYLDRRAFGYDRDVFLATWLNPPHLTLVYKQGQHIAGYGTIRKCHKGFKIGPLFADNDDVAISLFETLASNAEGEDIIIDVPENKMSFSRHLEGEGLTQSFVTARMYRGAPPRLEERLVYGITSLELG